MMYTWNFDPVAFSFLGLEIRWYGLAYLVAFFLVNYLGWWGYKKFTKDQKLSRKVFEDFIFSGFFIGILGGRFGYFLFYNPEIFWENPLEILKIWHGGMSIHGGVFAVVLFGIFWTKKQKISFWQLADILVFPLAIGLAIGRMANFVNGELVGRVTDQTWGVVFPHVDQFLRHPSQLYEVGKNLILAFIIFMALKNGLHKKQGTIFGIFVLGYGVFRFFIEFFREPEILIGQITMGQFLCGGMIFFGIIILWKKNIRHKK